MQLTAVKSAASLFFFFCASLVAASVAPGSLQPGVLVSDVVTFADTQPANDQVWYVFQATAGDALVIETSDREGDPCLELYSGDVTGVDFGVVTADCGTPLVDAALLFLATDDDGGEDTNARVAIQAPTTGTYSVMLTDVSSSGDRVDILLSGATVLAKPIPALHGLLGWVLAFCLSAAGARAIRAGVSISK